MNKPHNVKISIVTVCFNSVSTIEQTICSVVNQSYQDIEYIIIDGGSVDGTIDIVKKYEDRLAYWISEPDRGIYDAMNKGIDKATGEVVAFLNSDDWYEPGTLGFVAGQFADFDIQVLAGLLYYWIGDKCEIIDRHDHDFRLTMACSHPATFVRRKLFEQYGKFDLKYAISGDHDWLLRIYNEGVPYTYCKEALVNMRHGGASCKNEFLSRYESQSVCLSAALDLKAKNKINDDEYCELIRKINLFRYHLNCQYAARNALEERMPVDNKKLRQQAELLFSGEEYALFGCGKTARGCIEFFRKLGKRVVYCYDNNSDMWGKTKDGMKILSPQEIKKGESKIVITSEKYESEMIQQLEKKGLKRNLDFVCFRDLFLLFGAKMYGYL